MTDRAKFTLEEALAMSNHEFAEAFLSCEIEKVGIRFNESRAVLEAKLDDVARQAAELERERCAIFVGSDDNENRSPALAAEIRSLGYKS